MAGRRRGDDTDWAVTAATPDLEGVWSALKPHLAHRFPFELDAFQKEAFIHLEKVFVAHTQHTASL